MTWCSITEVTELAKLIELEKEQSEISCGNTKSNKSTVEERKWKWSILIRKANVNVKSQEGSKAVKRRERAAADCEKVVCRSSERGAPRDPVPSTTASMRVADACAAAPGETCAYLSRLGTCFAPSCACAPDLLALCALVDALALALALPLPRALLALMLLGFASC